jgi:AraC-like DNA-binding protein
MQKIDFIIPQDLEPYINCIIQQEKTPADSQTHIPIYADGYPGIMFHQTKKEFYLQPKGKKLSELFLYGQTLKPISLEAEGPVKFVVFQLYPFASKYLLGVDPRVLNDECFDLLQLKHIDVESYRKKLVAAGDLEKEILILADLVRDLIQSHQLPQDDKVQQAIDLIIRHKGQVSIKHLREELFVTERTIERKFMAETGLTPKQFAKIIQFQSSLNQLNQAKYDKLVEVSADSGFADQSHFIRTFKKYTGQTPSFYLAKKSS